MARGSLIPPQRVVPMQPELANEPFHREGWLYSRVRLVSHSGVEALIRAT
jgi:hypothetical protein